MNEAGPVLAPIEFRLDAQYRRCGIYVAVSSLLLAGFQAWLGRFVPGIGNDRLFSQVAILAAIGALGLLPLRWRLRVDEHGIWRRRIARWELWSWDDFRSGRLRFGFEDLSMVDGQRPRWRRTLHLGFLADDDQKRVWPWIQLVWKPPVREPAPELIEIRYGPWSTPGRFDARGAQLGRGKRLRVYVWDQVESLEIRRLRHERNDFRDLKLRFPRDRIWLTYVTQYGITSANWKGPEAAIVAEFLIGHVPIDRQLIRSKLDSPRTTREAEARVGDARKQFRQARWFAAITSILAIAGLVDGLAAQDIGLTVIVVGSFVIFAPVVFALQFRAARQHAEEVGYRDALARDCLPIESEPRSMSGQLAEPDASTVSVKPIALVTATNVDRRGLPLGESAR